MAEPRSRPAFFVLAALAVLLVAAVGLIIYGKGRPLHRTFYGHVADLLPPAPSGWTKVARPIADTPEMKQKVDELLSFDDGAFYDYTSGASRLSVYVAYWQPGKMSSRLVAGHTPDVCWVNAGWRCIQRGETSYPLRPVGAPGAPALSGSSRLFPAEARLYAAGGTTEYVWFWHLVDGVPQSYGTGKEPPWYAGLQDLVRRGLDQRSEQFFIRISSSQPLEDVSLQPALSAVLRSLPLRNKPAGATSEGLPSASLSP